MMRPGYFKSASIIPIGELPSGSGSKAMRPGMGGGCGDGFWVIGVVIGLLLLVSGKKMLERVPDGFVEISSERIVAKELHGEIGRADERTEVPGELGAKKKISRQPAQQNPPRGGATAADFFQ